MSIANSQPSTRFVDMTYNEIIEHTKKNHAATTRYVEFLTQAIGAKIEDIVAIANQHLAAKDMGELKKFFNAEYARYDAMLNADELIKKNQQELLEAVASCTPADVSLSQRQVVHMIKLGRDMHQFGKEELALSTASRELEAIASDLKELSEKTKVYFESYRIALNWPARVLQQSTREKRWIDIAPDVAIGQERYYNQGFDQYKKSIQKEPTKTSVTNS